MRRLTRRQRIAAIVLAALAAVASSLSTSAAAACSRRTAACAVRSARSTAAPTPCSARSGASCRASRAPGRTSRGCTRCEQQNTALRKQLAQARLDRHTAAELTRLQLAADARRVTAIVPGPRRRHECRGRLRLHRHHRRRHGERRASRARRVTDGDGLVGRVLHADSSTAVVLLAIDPGSGVGARDLRTGQLGVVTGDGRDGFAFRPLDPTAQVQAGDALATGPGRASSYVAGPVRRHGRARCARPPTARTIAAVDPTVSATALDVVGVIVSRHGGADGRRRRSLTMTRARVAAAIAALLTALCCRRPSSARSPTRCRPACPPLLVAAIAARRRTGCRARVRLRRRPDRRSRLGASRRCARAVLARGRAGVRTAATRRTRASAHDVLVATLVCGVAVGRVDAVARRARRRRCRGHRCRPLRDPRDR